MLRAPSNGPRTPDFGYEVAAAIPGVDDIEILPPRRLYARQGRPDEHDAMVAGAVHALGTFAVDHHGDEEGHQHGTS
jgi:phosphoenolpyruvate carboxykinase (ATP)